MFNSDHKYDNSFGSASSRRTKIQLNKSFSECESYDNDGVTETNFHSPAKSTLVTSRNKPKNTVAFQQPLFSLPQSSSSCSTTFKPALRTVSSSTVTNNTSSALSDSGCTGTGNIGLVDDFKKFNTVKTGGSNKSCLTNDALKTQYLLQQQQRIKEYNNASSRNNDLSYSDTYSSSSSDYRSIVKGGSGLGVATGANASNTSTSGRVLNSNVVSSSSGVGNSKNTLSTRKSTQSLCSCDAETEVRKNPIKFQC